MKKTLLCLLLLAFAVGFSKNPDAKTTVNPAIGVQMTAVFINDFTIQFNVKIKNIGEEPLTNIYATDHVFSGSMDFFSPIATLMPGEEVRDLIIIKYNNVGQCFDYSQIMVHATTPNNIEITDLSSDSANGTDSNNLPGSYYNDFPSQTPHFIQQIFPYQEGVYEDTNHNDIVDVGDVINYTYQITANHPGMLYEMCQIIDDNAIVTNANFTLTDIYSTTGIHYLTQADVDLGYVYNTSYAISPYFCLYYPFGDSTYCFNCPNPAGANMITKLTSLLPNKISGSVKFNANNDCTTALNFPNRRVSASNGTYDFATYTDASGNYDVLIPNSGSYDTSALVNLNSNFSSTPASITINSSGENTEYENSNFCIGSSTNYTDLRVNLFNVNQAIPGLEATYRLYYENIGTTSLNGTIELAYNGNLITSLSATPAAASDANSVVTWNYTNLLPFERRYIELSAMVFPPPAVNSGDTNTMTLTGNPIVGDNNPVNNVFVLNQKVFNSFDPNDKTVLEGETITASQATGYLNYITRFQNTGTANATTVVVKETLDADLDWSTFEPIDASHNYNIQIKNGNQLTYTFPHIDLAFESANEPASHGWLAYRIKPKSTFAIGDVASSKSDIYFDFNLPIITNNVNTVIAPLSTTGFMKNNFVIYPNPAKDFLTVENKSNLETSYEIMAANGQLLLKDKIENSKSIDISSLQNGFYLINLKVGEDKITYKFIKN